ncbi:hypothetical protein K490DRAFT_70498 [Saccharata proteae CBS 121410]|uniref:DDE-1 domain-containing protein n=1 Tax=Saccharata proteae CBS 121410 TaxID=1314787 RepID=A0A9P4HYR0_9PEZI|nr:hypothetical protein K490DRAFT_70498 [Saccharata proteae CBS 121410]
MHAVRHNADSEVKYKAYFNLLQEKIAQYNIQERNTYNIDEKGFMLGTIRRTKRIFNRQIWERKEVRAALQDGSREWITVIAAICADGTTLPPRIIYAASSDKVRSTWQYLLQAGVTMILG